MALISLHDVSVGFGSSDILHSITLQIEKNQRISLVGRNGAGKTTLLRVLQEDIAPDRGEVRKQQGLKVSYLPQKLPQIVGKTVFQVIGYFFGQIGDDLYEYNTLQRKTPYELSENECTKLDRLQHNLGSNDGWIVQQKIDTILSLMKLEGDVLFETLSGGQKRRVLLGRALVNEPDLLLLDEPTNHLDLESIRWLEDFIIRLGTTLLFITHDRMFLKKIATRILELDRGKVFDWSCDYETFIIRKRAMIDAEEKEWNRFDKKLAQEEVWIRKGIKARRTRNEGRARALSKMREERSNRQERSGSVSMKLQTAHQSGRLVLKARNLSYSYGDLCIIKDFSTTILRGDKIGIIGPNGSGKTTLLHLLLHKLTPNSGNIEHGTNIEILYFDQLRNLIIENKSVAENVLPNGDMVTVNGKQKHIISYLGDFLFTPEKAKTPVRDLSGGEINRLALAKLFTQKSNVIVFDEPTNDLDIETLELLEELLTQYQGTIVLVSHDRVFLNNIVTSILVFEGQGFVKEYIGGYDDYCVQKKIVNIDKTPKDQEPVIKKRNQSLTTKKLSFNETRELAALPTKIEAIEQEIEQLNVTLTDPEIYRIKESLVQLKQKIEMLNQDLHRAYQRWEELEERAQ